MRRIDAFKTPCAGVNRIILTLYLSLISAAFIDVNITDRLTWVVVLTMVLALVYYWGSGLLINRIKGISIRNTGISDRKKLGLFFAISAGICFFISIVWYIAYFPGTFTPDSLAQYFQASDGEFNNWHPALHTLLFFALPLKLTDGIWSIVFFQVVLVALATGYACMILYKHAGIKWAVGVELYLLLNPHVMRMVISPVKDTVYGLTGFVAMAMVYDFFCEPRFADSSNMISKNMLCGAILGLNAIFRHNGILFAGVMLIAIVFLAGFKRWLIVACSFIFTIMLIRGPVYYVFDVDMTNTSDVMQIVQCPMTVIGNVVVETPELLDEETAHFAYSIAPQKEWERVYETGNFSAVRYYADINPQPIEDAGVAKIVRMAGRCFISSPKASIKAFLALTDIVYGWDIRDDGWFGAGTYGLYSELDTTGIPKLANLLEIYYKIVRFHGLDFLRQTSFALLMLIMVILAKCDLMKWTDWRRILLCLPILAYNFGTMLFLGTSDARFFFITYPVCPIAIILLFMEKV